MAQSSLSALNKVSATLLDNYNYSNGRVKLSVEIKGWTNTNTTNNKSSNIDINNKDTS